MMMKALCGPGIEDDYAGVEILDAYPNSGLNNEEVFEPMSVVAAV